MAKGTKTGGRVKGTPNVRRSRLQAQVKATGITPLDFMLAEMRNQDNSKPFRAQMARDAAPYLHPKLASTEMTGKDGGPMLVKIIDYAVKA